MKTEPVPNEEVWSEKSNYKSIASKISAQIQSIKQTYHRKPDLPQHELDYLHKLEKELIRNDDSMILGSQDTPEKPKEQPIKQLSQDNFNSQSSLLQKGKGYLSYSEETKKIVKTQIS